MRRTLTLLAMLGLGVFLLVNPATGIFAPVTTDPETLVVSSTSLPVATTGAPPASGSDDAAPTPAPPPSSTSTTTAAPQVFAGPAVWSEWGYFQVEITVVDGVMTSVDLIDQPDDRKSRRINESAVPRYEAQALEVQGTDLDRISGATYTWRYFRESLAGAMETAGLVTM